MITNSTREEKLVKIADWVGRTETTEDVLDHVLVRRMAATLGTEIPGPTDRLPHLWHWMFFQPSISYLGLGEDGHPARGEFLPPAENRNRMWAGGRLQFLRPLLIGQAAKRISTISNIVEKQGKSGALLFVTVEHTYIQNGESAVLEQQDIVYREPLKYIQKKTTECPAGEWSEIHKADSVTLFRYSAVTFNAHRIHYDYPYVTEKEGYPGLLVQGQLLATLALQAFQKANALAKISSFNFRSQQPVFCPETFVVAGKLVSSNEADLWVGNDDGIAQSSHVEFAF